MKYRKPEVIDLGDSIQRAKGQVKVSPMACIAGGGAGSYEDCYSGSSAGSFASCVPGSDAKGGRWSGCYSGTSVTLYCEAGTSGSNDPFGCDVGPSFS